MNRILKEIAEHLKSGSSRIVEFDYNSNGMYDVLFMDGENGLGYEIEFSEAMMIIDRLKRDKKTYLIRSYESFGERNYIVKQKSAPQANAPDRA
jgi:hypothetical protein